MAVLKIVFSPTGGTENAAYIVANTLSNNAETIDLCVPACEPDQ